MGKLSPHSVGSGVPKTGSVPAFNNVVETSPASSVVKIPFRGSSAVECAFSIGGLEQWQTGAAIVGGFPSIAVSCKHDHIYRKRQSAIVHALGNRSKRASLFRSGRDVFAMWYARRCESWIGSVECLVGDELAVSTPFTVCRKLHFAVQIIILHHFW